MSILWRRLERRTIFVSCSSDMAAEAAVIRAVVEELNRQLPSGDRWDLYHWTAVDETWSAAGTWQQNIPRASDENVKLVICLFGERLGTPLPSYFPLPPELTLPNWVAFPGTEVSEAQSIPLTGTLFELLDATQKTRGNEIEGPAVLCYFKADLGRFGTPDLLPEKRGYGFEHLYSRLAQGGKRITPLSREHAYDNQVALLNRFCDAYFRHEGHAYKCFGSETAGPNGCLEALRDRLLKDLPPLLGISDAKANTRELKGLAAYQPEDHDILFGRDAQIDRILKRLKDLALTNRLANSMPLLVLTGRGGEGKSSLLRAGLVGRLQQRRYPDFGHFLALVTDSLSLGKDDPVARLTEVINHTLGGRLWDGQHELADFTPAERITKIVEGVRQALSTSKQNNSAEERRLFIGLDQFEELLVSAHENSENRTRVLELLTLLQTLAQERLAWIVLVLPTDQVDQLTELIPDWNLPEEELGAPSVEDLRVIVERSLTVAHLETNRSDIDSVVDQAAHWLERQENPGPVLPLLSGLMVEMVRVRRNAWKKILEIEDTSASEATIDSVVNLLGERAWDEARMESDIDAVEVLERLLRQLVLTGIKEGGSFKINRPCSVTHPAVVRADSLVRALKKHRLIYYPQHDSMRLTHVSIIDYWKRAASWYETDHYYQQTLALLEYRAQNQPARPITDAQELAGIEDLWNAWYADRDRLSHVLELMRASLIEAFDPVARPESWRRPDNSSRFCEGLATNDPAVVDHYLSRVAAMPEEARLELVRFANPNSGDTAMHFAAFRGNLEVVQQLISLGAEIDVPNESGRTPIRVAIDQGHSELVSALLDQNVNFYQKDEDGASLLLAASWMGRERIVRLLLDRGAEVNSQNDYGWTALLAAARRGHQEIVRNLLDHGAEVDQASDAALAPLALAAANGDESLVRVLLERGAWIDRATSQNETALFWAVYNGHLHIVRLLLDKGANVNFAGKECLTPLIAAAIHGHEAVAQLLLERGAEIESKATYGITALFAAATQGLLQLVEQLLNRGAVVNHTIDDGRTALSMAASGGQDAVVDYLLEHGAEIDKADNSDQTALALAAINGHPTTIELLLSHGAKLHPNALMNAALLGHETVVRCLLEHGADVEVTRPNGETALTASAIKGHKQIVEDLLKHGANPNHARDDGDTALSLASGEGHEEIVMLLLKGGAEVNHIGSGSLNVLGRAVLMGHENVSRVLLNAGADLTQTLTPAILQKYFGDVEADVAANYQVIPMIAAQKGNESIMRLLLDRGANVETVAPDGHTLLMYAASSGNEEITRLLIERNAPIHHKCKHGKTALGYAIEKGVPGVVAVLFDHGAYLDETPTDGAAVAIVAARMEQKDIVQMFLDRGISANATDSNDDDDTLLRIAVHNGNESVIALLIERGADVDRPSASGVTPLLTALALKNEAVVKMLLEAGANVDGVGETRYTPLIAAAVSDEPALVQILLDHGAKIDQRNSDGVTALGAMRNAGRMKMARFLIEHGAETNQM